MYLLHLLSNIDYTYPYRQFLTNEKSHNKLGVNHSDTMPDQHNRIFTDYKIQGG